MSPVTDQLISELQATLQSTLRLEAKVASLKQGVLALERRVEGIQAEADCFESRMDRLDRTLTRIELRLELV